MYLIYNEGKSVVAERLVRTLSYVFKTLVVLHCIKISQCCPKPCEPFGGDFNVKVDLSNYATKSDIKNISLVHTSSFALKTKLANLKTKGGRLDINKLVRVSLILILVSLF